MSLRTSLIQMISLIMVLFFLACNNQGQNGGSQRTSKGNTSKPTARTQNLLIFNQPESNSTLTIGDVMKIEVDLTQNDIQVDSIRLQVDGKVLGMRINPPYRFEWNTTGWMPGKRSIQAELFISGTMTGRRSISVVLLSDMVPPTKKCNVLNVFPHDPQAYTQGLIIDQGFLYESTGVRGKSSLRKLDLESGTLLASLNLPPDLFGEGICVFNDKIIQLTWTSGYGFIYDKYSFKFLRKIQYGTQGWGVTFNGEHLIMSDGSHQLIFLDTLYFREIYRIEVYDHEGSVQNLNELEYIQGKIYANIYTTDLIAIIDPGTGKVLSYIDCAGLLNETDRGPETDVLNGIAYDPSSDQLFITGKYWPKLFEIEMMDQ